MRNKPREIIIENNSKNLELEQKLVQFVEEEINGVLIADNKWKCNLSNSSWTVECIRKEITYLVNGDPGRVLLSFCQKHYFWQREHWTQIDIHSGKKHYYSANTKYENKSR